MSSSYSVWIADSTHSSIVHEPDVSTTFLLDTNVLIDVAGGTPLGFSDDVLILVSAISLVELAAPRHMDLEAAESLIDDVSSGDVIPLTRDISRMAVELRTVQSLSVIDACIAATACIKNATLVTNDGQLRRHPVLTTCPFPLRLKEEDNNP